MKRITLLLFVIAIAWLPSTSSAQTQILESPNASPKALTGQTIGLTDVYVSYHRPAVKERKVWGKLVPYGAVWRAGANDNTVIKFTEKVSIEGKELAAGKYGLHMIPGEQEWVIIFSKDHSAWGSYSYNEKNDALRVNVKPRKTEAFEEYLSYGFTGLESDQATCVLHWANLEVPFAISVDVHESVVNSMRKELNNKAGFSWQGWHEAANYCLVNDVNHKEALQWASRSVFSTPTPQNMVVKAKLAAKVKGDQKAAWKTLEKDLEAMPCTWKEYNAAATYAMQEGEYDKAFSWSDQAVAMNPTMTAMMTKAKIMKAKGDKKGAEKAYEAAIDKGSNGELNNYGYQLLFSGKTEKAIKVFEANVDKHPEDPNVWDSLGEAYVAAGEKEKAVKVLKKSLSLNPPPNVKANSLKLLAQLGIEYEASTKP
ncbi:MAG: DUF2911 domain-containing protein [Chitinophagales bacterium]|nr:DUF2911 domain-containing protein [Chitinophagales bacterium]